MSLTDDCLVMIPSSPPESKADMMRLTARDTVDSGRNAVIENSLEARQYSQFFTIDPDSGQIRLGRPLPSVGSGEFQLNVAATDQGSPPLTSTATITLMLRRTGTRASMGW